MADVAVTVVVPTHNRVASLRRLLAALERCVPPPGGFEVVVVDDGSTDGTHEFLSTAGAAHVAQAQAGPAAARNRGWRTSSAPLVAFTDDDCIPDPGWLVEMVRPFDDPSVVGVGGRIQPLTPSFIATFVQLERQVDHGLVGDGVQARYLVTANAAFRRSAIEAVGGFDERFPSPAGEDVDLSWRLVAAGGKLVVTPDATVAHDHRVSLVGVLRTFAKHGRARAALRATHPHDSVASAARGMASPTYWCRRYRDYRAVAGRMGAIGYVALRVVGLACYGTALWRAARRPLDAGPSEPSRAPARSGEVR